MYIILHDIMSRNTIIVQVFISVQKKENASHVDGTVGYPFSSTFVSNID
jgi:hypothetical protein